MANFFPFLNIWKNSFANILEYYHKIDKSKFLADSQINNEFSDQEKDQILQKNSGKYQ